MPACASRCVIVDFHNTLCTQHFFEPAPPGIPNWRQLFDEQVFSPNHRDRLTHWCTGRIRSIDTAHIIDDLTGLPTGTVLAQMRAGCSNLRFYPSVVEFVAAQRAVGRKVALVTANLDIFTEVVVPAHGLDRSFDVIVNSILFSPVSSRSSPPLRSQHLARSTPIERLSIPTQS
jgi:phosphoserine phosphatase